MVEQKTLELIKHFESLHDGDESQIGLQPKMDPVGIWTEGYGRAMVDPATKRHIRGASNKARAYALISIDTEEEAEEALRFDYVRLGEKPAQKALGVEEWKQLKNHQRGALSTFVYNCGTHNPATKNHYLIFGMIRKWLRKEITDQQLSDYWASSVIKSGGKVLPGLIRRRRAEAHYFFTNTLKFYF